jgi:hypothetical protein
MRSGTRGNRTSAVEVVNISIHGIWIHVLGHEYFMSHEDYPWFREATIAQIQNVKLLRGHHLHWPELDVDLELESLQFPEKYPLKYRKE